MHDDFLCGDGIEDKLVVCNENISHFIYHLFWRAKTSSCGDANLSILQ
jgi:hypothetical protein